MTTQTEALHYLESFADQLEHAGADAAKEAATAQAEVSAHESVVDHFTKTGEGLLESIKAKAALDGIDSMLFGSARPSASLAQSARSDYFSRYGERSAAAAKEALVRKHGIELSNALKLIITDRTRGRAKWRVAKVAQIQAIEAREMLEDLSEHDGRVLRDQANRLDAEFVSSEEMFRSAVQFAEKLRVSPTLETLADARGFADNLRYE